MVFCLIVRLGDYKILITVQFLFVLDKQKRIIKKVYIYISLYIYFFGYIVYIVFGYIFLNENIEREKLYIKIKKLYLVDNYSQNISFVLSSTISDSNWNVGFLWH